MIKHLSKKLWISAFLLAGFLAILPTGTKANLLGAEIRYELLDDSLFVYLNTFDDYAYGRSARIDQNFFVTSPNSNKTIRDQFKLISTTDVTATCENTCTNYSSNTCANPNTLVKLKYGAVVSIAEFSSADCELMITWSSYYRPNTWDKYYLQTSLNACIDGNNSSPEILNNPYHIIPFNEAYSYSWKAQDDDGDSLVYELIEAKTSGMNAVSYAKGLSHKIPFNYYGQPQSGAKFPRGFHFDSKNGLLRFYPVKEMSNPVVVQVSEYRNGEKIGESVREVLMEVKNVENKKPIVSGINGGNKETITACVDQELCFYVQADDGDAGDDVSFTWDTDIPNVSIKANENKKSVLNICWVPTTSDLIRGSFYLKITAKDNSCELEGRYERVFNIKVAEPFTAKFEYDITACKEVTIVAKTDALNEKKLNYKWKIDTLELFGKELIYNYVNGGNVKAKLKVENDFTGCYDEFESDMVLPKMPSVAIVGENEICSGSELFLSAKGAKNYTWKTSIDNTTHKLKDFKTSLISDAQIIVEGIDKYGCTDNDTFNVTVNEPLINAVTAEEVVCKGLEIEVEANGAENYSWSNNGLQDFNDNRAVYSLTRSQAIEVSGIDKNGCFGTKQVMVNVDQDCVWPGDINGDEYVNNKDVLMLGLSYNTQNPSPDQDYRSPVWLPYSTENWSESFGDNRNYKHADANNDGIIDYEDLLVIDRFYSREITYSNKKNNTGYKLYFDYDIDSIKGKDVIEITVSLGTENEPAKDVYGIAFTIDYNKIVDTTSISFNTQNSWLAKGANTIKLVKNIPNKGNTGGGKIDIAYTRTGKKPKSGSGKVGSVKFVVQDDIDWKKLEYIELLLESIEIVNEKGERLDAYGEAASIQISDLISSVKSIPTLTGISAFPNPVTDNQIHVNISSEHENVIISLMSLTGKTVIAPSVITSGVNTVDLGSVQQGYYLVVFETDNGQYTTPIVIK